MIWKVTTDGSVAYDRRQGDVKHPSRGWGGWAAIVEHGSDGYVVRGSEELPPVRRVLHGSEDNTTAVRMELRAVEHALAAIPDGEEVLVVTDATIITVVHERWTLGTLPYRNEVKRDQAIWLDLAAHYARLRVSFHLLGRTERNHVHKRAHLIAGAAAKAARAAALGHPKRDDPEKVAAAHIVC